MSRVGESEETLMVLVRRLRVGRSYERMTLAVAGYRGEKAEMSTELIQA
jgi:hypothetical protein